jgi:hypothetical protein
MSYHPGDFRPSRARFVTICPDCGDVVGVTQDKFNHVGSDSVSKADHVWRSTVHRSKATSTRCVGARTVVHQNLVWGREEISV